MIRLYQFPPIWGLPSVSPFCMKVEIYLRMADLAYEVVPTANPRRAPKGKLPYIDDDGKLIADSGLIVDYLEAKYGAKIDGGLTARDAAVSLAFRRLIEEHLYWGGIYARWDDEAGWARAKAAYFGRLPLGVRSVIAAVVRRGMLKDLRGQGMGRHTGEEICEIATRDVSALSSFLDEKDYFMGSEPTTLDATAYAFLAHLLWAPIENPIRAKVAGSANLSAYCQRMRARFHV